MGLVLWREAAADVNDSVRLENFRVCYLDWD